MTSLSFSPSLPRRTQTQARTSIPACAHSRPIDEQKYSSKRRPADALDRLSSGVSVPLPLPDSPGLPYGVGRPIFSSYSARSYVDRVFAVLSSLRQHPSQLDNLLSEADSSRESHAAPTPDAGTFLRSVAPWSKRAERQRDMLLEGLRYSPASASKRGLYIFYLRALKHARCVAADADEIAGVTADARDEENAQKSLKDTMRRLGRVSMQYARVRRVGDTPNVQWRSVDRAVLRAHISWENLPLPGSLSIVDATDLRFLRQDCEAWFEARSLIQVNASTVWKALGFGEQRAARRLGISKASGMRSHDCALQAYEQMRDPQPYMAKRRLEEASDTVQNVYRDFGSLHEAGAMLAYIAWENGTYSNMARQSRQKVNGVQPGTKFAEMVRIQEAGLYVLEKESIPEEYYIDYNDVPVIAASPDGIVRRRRGDEFGAWEINGTEVVEVKCRVPFIPLGDGKWMFRFATPRKGVTAVNYAQVQFQMLCGGPHVRRATVVSYAVLGGMTITAVERDDAWLKSALRVLAGFYAEYVWPGRPPEHDFFADRPDYAAFVELTRDSMRKAEVVAEVSPEEADLALLPKNAEEKQRFNKWRTNVFNKNVMGS